DAEEVERRRQREHLEVADGDQARLLRDEERVLLGGVELDRELAAGEGERVPCGAVDLDRGPERERILQHARRALLPEVAALEQSAHAAERGDEPGVRARLGDRGMKDGDVCRKAL